MTQTTDPVKLQLIQDYLRGRLSEQAQSDFELAMFDDSELARDTELQQSMTRSMKDLSLSAWSTDQNQPKKSVWTFRIWRNAALAWAIAGGCAVAVLVGVISPDVHLKGISISNSIAVHTYRGADQKNIEITLSQYQPNDYLLLAIDTAHTNRTARLSLHRPRESQPIVAANGRTNDLGTLTVALPTLSIPKGSLILGITYQDGSLDEWRVEVD